VSKYIALSDSDIQHFIEKGFVAVQDCLPKPLIEEWIDRAWVRLGYDRDDPSTWPQPRIHLPNMECREMKHAAPKMWAAACDLLGGADRIEEPQWMFDGFIINFNLRAGEPWKDPSPSSPGWHKDGDFFRHYLDSPEQGLLSLVYWTNVAPRSGGTFVACDSVRAVARYLHDHPEGTILSEFNFGSLVEGCREFVETTGKAGDVFLLHPFILHAASQNLSPQPRFLTNPPIHLREPMNFNRDDPEDFSPVERAVLHALGVERIDYRITGPRERVESERMRQHRLMAEEQKHRLEAAGIK
jgi:hypothetical protein